MVSTFLVIFGSLFLTCFCLPVSNQAHNAEYEAPEGPTTEGQGPSLPYEQKEHAGKLAEIHSVTGGSRASTQKSGQTQVMSGRGQKSNSGISKQQTEYEPQEGPGTGTDLVSARLNEHNQINDQHRTVSSHGQVPSVQHQTEYQLENPSGKIYSESYGQAKPKPQGKRTPAGQNMNFNQQNQHGMVMNTPGLKVHDKHNVTRQTLSGKGQIIKNETKKQELEYEPLERSSTSSQVSHQEGQVKTVAGQGQTSKVVPSHQQNEYEPFEGATTGGITVSHENTGKTQALSNLQAWYRPHEYPQVWLNGQNKQGGAGNFMNENVDPQEYYETMGMIPDFFNGYYHDLGEGGISPGTRGQTVAAGTNVHGSNLTAIHLGQNSTSSPKSKHTIVRVGTPDTTSKSNAEGSQEQEHSKNAPASQRGPVTGATAEQSAKHVTDIKEKAYPKSVARIQSTVTSNTGTNLRDYTSGTSGQTASTRQAGYQSSVTSKDTSVTSDYATGTSGQQGSNSKGSYQSSVIPKDMTIVALDHAKGTSGQKGSNSKESYQSSVTPKGKTGTASDYTKGTSGQKSLNSNGSYQSSVTPKDTTGTALDNTTGPSGQTVSKRRTHHSTVKDNTGATTTYATETSEQKQPTSQNGSNTSYQSSVASTDPTGAVSGYSTETRGQKSSVAPKDITNAATMHTVETKGHNGSASNARYQLTVSSQDRNTTTTNYVRETNGQKGSTSQKGSNTNTGYQRPVITKYKSGAGTIYGTGATGQNSTNTSINYQSSVASKDRSGAASDYITGTSGPKPSTSKTIRNGASTVTNFATETSGQKGSTSQKGSSSNRTYKSKPKSKTNAAPSYTTRKKGESHVPHKTNHRSRSKVSNRNRKQHNTNRSNKQAIQPTSRRRQWTVRVNNNTRGYERVRDIYTALGLSASWRKAGDTAQSSKYTAIARNMYHSFMRHLRGRGGRQATKHATRSRNRNSLGSRGREKISVTLTDMLRSPDKNYRKVPEAKGVQATGTVNGHGHSAADVLTPGQKSATSGKRQFTVTLRKGPRSQMASVTSAGTGGVQSHAGPGIKSPVSVTFRYSKVTKQYSPV